MKYIVGIIIVALLLFVGYQLMQKNSPRVVPDVNPNVAVG